MQTTPYHMRIRCKWATRKQRQDRGGKICQKRTQYTKHNRTTHQGATHTERGNGANLHRICRRQQMIPMATWKKQRLLRQDKWKQQSATTTKENWEKENREKYLTTRTSPDGDICRQIDYIMINAKHRDVVRKAQSNIYWHGNMHQNQQRRARTMQLYYSASKSTKNQCHRRQAGN